jgi:hypothetical protein
MTLSPEIVDFIGLDGPQDPIERTGVVEVAVDQMEAPMRGVRIFIDGIDMPCVKRAGPADDAVDVVALPEE